MMDKKILRILIVAASLIYGILKLLPVQRKVALMSRLNRSTSIDFQLLSEEIAKQHPDARIVVLNHRMYSQWRHAFDVLIEMYHLATSRAAILDSYIIPVSILNHRKDLIVLQVWHGLGAIKQFGHCTIGKPAGNARHTAEIMRMHRNYTYVCAGSRAMTAVFARCFGVDESKIVPVGMPRVDYLLSQESVDNARGNIDTLFPNLGSKKVVLYAPTFRKGSKIAAQKLIDAVDLDRYALIVKQHTHDKTRIKARAGVKVVKEEIDSLDLLHAADYVVTDYSAIAFEAALISKPLFFWNYDYGYYKKTCGYAINYHKEMPGTISSEAKDIVKAIECQEYDMEAIRRFARKYIDIRNGSCTRQIVGLLCL